MFLHIHVFACPCFFRIHFVFHIKKKVSPTILNIASNYYARVVIPVYAMQRDDASRRRDFPYGDNKGACFAYFARVADHSGA